MNKLIGISTLLLGGMFSVTQAHAGFLNNLVCDYEPYGGTKFKCWKPDKIKQNLWEFEYKPDIVMIHGEITTPIVLNSKYLASHFEHGEMIIEPQDIELVYSREVDFKDFSTVGPLYYPNSDFIKTYNKMLSSSQVLNIDFYEYNDLPVDPKYTVIAPDYSDADDARKDRFVGSIIELFADATERLISIGVKMPLTSFDVVLKPGAASDLGYNGQTNEGSNVVTFAYNNIYNTAFFVEMGIIRNPEDPMYTTMTYEQGTYVHEFMHVNSNIMAEEYDEVSLTREVMGGATEYAFYRAAVDKSFAQNRRSSQPDSQQIGYQIMDYLWETYGQSKAVDFLNHLAYGKYSGAARVDAALDAVGAGKNYDEFKLIGTIDIPCSDSDGGMDLFTPGSATGASYSTFELHTVYDSCSNGYIREATCTGIAEGVIADNSASGPCEFGCNSDGNACNESVQ
jgi:hypothetical protein